MIIEGTIGLLDYLKKIQLWIDKMQQWYCPEKYNAGLATHVICGSCCESQVIVICNL